MALRPAPVNEKSDVPSLVTSRRVTGMATVYGADECAICCSAGKLDPLTDTGGWSVSMKPLSPLGRLTPQRARNRIPSGGLTQRTPLTVDDREAKAFV